jgi:hypothetical protein
MERKSPHVPGEWINCSWYITILILSYGIIICNGRGAYVSFALFVYVHVSLCSVFRVVLFAMISAYKPCSIRVNLQLFVGQRMSYLRDVCLFAYSSVQQILVLFLFCFSTSCVSYVANISGLSFFDCPFGILYRFLNCLNYLTNQCVYR